MLLVFLLHYIMYIIYIYIYTSMCSRAGRQAAHHGAPRQPRPRVPRDGPRLLVACFLILLSISMSISTMLLFIITNLLTIRIVMCYCY